MRDPASRWLVSPRGSGRRGRGCRGAAHDDWAHELRRLRQLGVVEFGDREAGLADGIERGAVAVTADHEPVEPVHPVLQASQGGVLGAQVLEEQEPPAGTQHPAQLAQGPGLVIDPAQDQRRDRHVEGVVLEREVLGRGAQHRRGRALLMDPPFQAPQHRGLGLGDRQGPDLGAVAGQVESGAAADLDDVAARAGQQALPHGMQPGLLGLGYLAVVRQGEELAPQAHGVLFPSRER